MSKVLAYLHEEDGASAAEYALILATVGAALSIACVLLGGAIGSAMNSADSCISSAGANC